MRVHSMVMAKFLTILTILAFLGILHPALATIPDPYYVNVSWDDHTIHGIETLLGDGLTVPYKFDVFDCSERSAYVQWLLQCHGFDVAFIVDGSGPWAGSMTDGTIVQHMWLAVNFYDVTGVYEDTVYIEASCDPMTIIQYPDPDWGKYFRVITSKTYTNLTDLIEDAQMDEDEVDWWQFGTDLVKKPAYEGINFKTTTPIKTNAGRTFRVS
jgi:hypothetical protein